ncbi:MAG: hypothetical protein DRQ78_08355 [Epsilonproteobacteria bacterium]|nr:MAG: hypothetical protein DRQ78_08355 [Campylobacterota bacterium]
MFFELTTEEVEEASSMGKAKASALYDVKINFVARYDSPGTDSKGFYINGELEDGFNFDQYINFQKKDGGANKFGQLDINALFTAMELPDGSKPEGPYQLKMWGSEREGFPIKAAGGRIVKLMLRDTEELGDDGVLRNKLIMEGAVCKDGRSGVETIKGIALADATDVTKWQAKIAKNPTKGAGKPKAKPAATATASPSAGWGA